MLAEESLGDRHHLDQDQPARRPASAQGTGGSGKTVTIKGADRARPARPGGRSSTAALKPLLVTDAFDFGLGICGVGGYSATTKLSWYLKVNHKNPELGGETVKLKAGDEVLWALAAYPYPDELALVAPDTATPGCRSRSASSPTTTRGSASRPPA